MEIIVEYVLLDNFLIDLTILYLTCKILKEPFKKVNCIISSLLGSISAVLFPLLSLPNILLLLIKLMIGISMTLIAFNCKKVKKFCLEFFTFFTISMLLGGVSYALILICGGEIASYNNFAYTLNFPIGIIYVFLAVYIYFLLCLFKRFYSVKSNVAFLYDITIFCKNKSLNTKAFLDSGNVLQDTLSLSPIIIFGYATFNKLFDVPLTKILLKKITQNDINSSRYITTKTLTGTTQMLVFETDKICIYQNGKIQKELISPVCALSTAKFQKNFGCDVLLNNKSLI